MKSEDLVAIGVVSGTHGYKGTFKVRSLSSHPERFRALQTVLLDSARGIREFPVESCTAYQDGLLIKLEGIDSKEDAMTYRHARLCVAESDVFPLPEGEYYHFQLLGLEVFDAVRGSLGPVSDILETGANDVYVTQSPRYGEVLIPALEHVILQIDLERRRMDVQLPDGLLDD